MCQRGRRCGQVYFGHHRGGRLPSLTLFQTDSLTSTPSSLHTKSRISSTPESLPKVTFLLVNKRVQIPIIKQVLPSRRRSVGYIKTATLVKQPTRSIISTDNLFISTASKLSRWAVKGYRTFHRQEHTFDKAFIGVSGISSVSFMILVVT